MEKDWEKILFIKDPRLGFLALAIAAALSAIFAKNHWLAFQGSLDFLKMYILFVIVATDFSDKKSIKIITATVIISTVLVTIGALSEYKRNNLNSSYIELNSVGHVNHTAIYLALSFVLSITFLRTVKNILEKILISLAAIVILSAVLLTDARATVSSIVAVVTIIFIFMKKEKQFTHILISLIVATVIIMLFVAPSKFSQQYTSIFAASFHSRIELWEKAWEMFISHPVVGVGAKHFRFYNTFDSGSHAHSLYFNTLAQLGIVGAVSLSLLFYLIIKSLYNSYEKSSLWHSALGAFIIVIVNGILNTSLHSEHGLLFSLILAVGLNSKGSGATGKSHLLQQDV
ncbi:MAG: O-antigen ligase family protein [Nitrospirae bacterium]|nr:O-antigen ligase family protein [Nitrospirota bacterium]